MGLAIDGMTNVADVKFGGVRGDRGLGYHRVGFDVTLTLHPQPADRPLALVGIVAEAYVQRAGGQGREFLGVARSPSGQSRSEHPQAVPGARPYECRTYLEIEMDAARVRALEGLRAGGDLRFSLTLRATFQRDRGPLHEGCDQATYASNQSEWATALERMGYGRFILIEVPAPDAASRPELAKAAEALRLAEDAVRRGEWREAVGRCRDVFEAVETAKSDKQAVDGAFAAPNGKNQRDLTFDERLLAVRKALKLLTHPARHYDESTIDYEWRGEDAYAMVAMTAALIRKLAAPPPPF